MEVIAEEKTVHEANDGDYVQYLIVSNHHHPLSNSIMSSISRVQFRRIDKVTPDDIHAADLVFIVDNGFDEVEFCNFNKKLVQKRDQFRLAFCLCHSHRNRWYTSVDSVFLTKGDAEQRNIINGLIESIELQGMICVDFADIYSVFCNMKRSFYYHGISEGKWRSVGAIDDAIEKRSFECKTAMVILLSGLEFTLDDFEMAANYFSTKIPEDTCCVFAHRLDPDRLYEDRFEVMIFINE
ncbi:hypothetical protein [Vibrio nereis]|uniref:Uncharacterized protein n=1 Tax=Vibrio nereis TaxID=693 RepID=A0A0M0HSB2_VIBNE|nr:hypothetical protein [Vibrio nereis]KOO04807.1 hypothetical protein AKJ17_03840 [Vibrio nereis]